MDFYNSDFPGNETDCDKNSCGDPTCPNCQLDDGEAAFWDQFLAEEAGEIEEPTQGQLHMFDEVSGEEFVIDQVNLKPFTILKYN